MDQTEFVKQLVLSEISDDYENVDQVIFPKVAKAAREFGFSVERSCIVEALRRLLADGLAEAYILSTREPFAVRLEDMPDINTPEVDFKTYFLITQKGLVYLSDQSSNI